MISEKLEKIYVSCYAFMYCIIENYVHKFVNNAIVSIYLPDGNYVDVNYKWRTRIPKDTFVIFMSQSSILWNLKTDLFLNFKGNYRTTHHACLEWLLSPLDHQPMYRYAHILCPHPPFVFSDNASATYGLMVQDHTTNTDAKLIPQIRANIAGIDAMVLPILKQLTQQPNPPIILLHSDHGTTTGIYPSKVDDSFGNLLALYIPDTWKSDAKDLTFINLYRFILNHLFNDHRPYIEQNRQIIRGKIFDPVNNNWNHIPK